MREQLRFVSVARFAELVGLSERTCWALIRQQRLPVLRVGRRTLIKLDDGVAAIERIGGYRTQRKGDSPQS